MPPLSPNVTKAGLLRSLSGWNNSSLSRRSGTMVGLLSTRTPQSSINSGGGILNPSFGIGVVREAFPRGATGTWQPISLSFSISSSPWSKVANGDNLPGLGTLTLNNFDSFGLSVAVSGNTIVVGAPYDDTGGLNRGAVYIRESGNWSKVANGDNLPGLGTLTLNNDDNFGYSAAVSGNTIVVGARRDDTGGTDGGAVYIRQPQ